MIKYFLEAEEDDS